MNKILIVFTILFSLVLSDCKHVDFSLQTKKVSLDGKVIVKVKNKDIKDQFVKAELFSRGKNIAFLNVAFKDSGTYSNKELKMQIIDGTKTGLYSGLKLRITFTHDKGKNTDSSTKLNGFKTFSFKGKILNITKSSSKNTVFVVDYLNSQL